MKIGKAGTITTRLTTVSQTEAAHTWIERALSLLITPPTLPLSSWVPSASCWDVY